MLLRRGGGKHRCRNTSLLENNKQYVFPPMLFSPLAKSSLVSFDFSNFAYLMNVRKTVGFKCYFILFRSGHAFAAVGQVIYMFGGCSAENIYCTDVYALDTGIF